MTSRLREWRSVGGNPYSQITRFLTGGGASHAGICGGLIIGTTAEHPHVLPLILPVLHKILFAEPLLVAWSVRVVELVEEITGSSEESLRVVDLGHREAATEQVGCGVDQSHALLDVVDEVHAAVGVGAVNVRKLDG